MVPVGLRLLSHLWKLEDEDGDKPLTDLIMCFICFSRTEDPWTTQASSTEALNWLQGFVTAQDAKRTDFQYLLTDLLRNYVKPAFVRSKNSTVTPAGRKAISSLPPKIEASIDEKNTKPWKNDQIYILSVFEWILAQLNVRNHFPLNMWTVADGTTNRRPPLRAIGRS